MPLDRLDMKEQRQAMTAETAKENRKQPKASGKTASAQKSTKKRRLSKDQVREVFLSRLPKGGVAIEIGVWHGDFSVQILKALEPEKLFLIDPWANVTDSSHSEAFAGRTEDTKMERIFSKVKKRFGKEISAGRVELIREFSGTALEGFEAESIDFAYVDGDHSYEGVCADLKALFPKMKTGGIMAFDDYHRRGWWGDGVIRAINEFLGQYPDRMRIRTVAGAQIAIEKIEPLDEVTA